MKTHFFRLGFLFLTQPRLLHYLLPILMVYLGIGTVAQKYIGLYEATNLYFSSWFIWVSGIPVPGTPIILGLIFINLAMKLIFKSPWAWEKAGIILTHISILLLLLGGLLTAVMSREGYLDIAMGERKDFVHDYHHRELVVMNEKGEQLIAFPHKELYEGQMLDVSALSLPIEFKVLEYCRNCKISLRDNASEIHKGMAQHMQLSPDELRVEDEENLSGVTLELSLGGENGETQRAIYTIVENAPQRPEITLDDEKYQILLQRQKRDLPFSVELLSFEKHLHPGTNLAREYKSAVRVHDGTAQWDSVISMNEPLRYKGYTLYQASFFDEDGRDVSVLSVVQNAGRIFPYISALAMCVGLILHLVVRRRISGEN